MTEPTLDSSANQLPGLYQSALTDAKKRPFYHLDGRDEVVVFIHGFTGSPADFQLFCPTYRDAGFDFVVPLMPGHGSHAASLEGLSFRELFIPYCPLITSLRKRYRKVHVVGLSYGGVIATRLALLQAVDSLCLLAPAFFLDRKSEFKMRWVKRLRLYRFKSRIKKDARVTANLVQPNLSYPAIPLYPAVELHDQARILRHHIRKLKPPVLHVHGDNDLTTPIQRNRQFLRRHIPQYHFELAQGGPHILPLCPQYEHIANTHLSWLADLDP